MNKVTQYVTQAYEETPKVTAGAVWRAIGNKNTTHCIHRLSLLNVSLGSSLRGCRHVPVAIQKVPHNRSPPKYNTYLISKCLYIVSQSEKQLCRYKGTLRKSHTQDLIIRAHIIVDRFKRSRYKMRNSTLPNQLNCGLHVSQDVLLILCVTDQV